MQKAQQYYWIIIIAFSLGFFLKAYIAKQSYIPTTTPIPFEVPTFISLDTCRQIEPHRRKALRSFYPSFLGKYTFSDSMIWQERQYNQDYVEPYYDNATSLSSDGLQLIPRPDIQFKDPINEMEGDKAFFPVFIPNESSQPKILHGKSAYTFAIQEAKDSNGFWHPIEHRGFDWCGVGRWALKIHPQEYGVMLMPVYEGNYATDLRIRFKNGDQITVSKPYPGRISYEQFYMNEKYTYKKWYDEDPLRFTTTKCYGAYPISQ